MCTAISFQANEHYFGRNLDLEYSYQETVTITPRNYPFSFREEKPIKTHYAIIGMAYVQDDYPLYYDAMNEKGLCMAGLNFPHFADYKEEAVVKSNITPFEFIPWVLSQCENVNEAKNLLEYTNLYQENFSEELPLTPLHWMISDKENSIVVEPLKSGLKIYDNPVGVLTNSPDFNKQLSHLNQYMHLSAKEPENKFSKKISLLNYSNGMGAIGLPGDWSSMSRFVKAAFVKSNSISVSNLSVKSNTKSVSNSAIKSNSEGYQSEDNSIGQFFHILDSVAFPKGSVILGNNKSEITVYSCCLNADKGIYYYKTYENSQITAVDLYEEDLEGENLTSYPLKKKQQIRWQNR